MGKVSETIGLIVVTAGVIIGGIIALFGFPLIQQRKYSEGLPYLAAGVIVGFIIVLIGYAITRSDK